MLDQYIQHTGDRCSNILRQFPPGVPRFFCGRCPSKQHSTGQRSFQAIKSKTTKYTYWRMASQDLKHDDQLRHAPDGALMSFLAMNCETSFAMVIEDAVGLVRR